MTKENIIRLHKHFSLLAKNEFRENDFYVEYPSKHKEGEAGRTSLGKMSPDRRKLIVSDALANKEALEKKHPWLLEAEKPKEEKKEVKSKGAK